MGSRNHDNFADVIYYNNIIMIEFDVSEHRTKMMLYFKLFVLGIFKKVVITQKSMHFFDQIFSIITLLHPHLRRGDEDMLLISLQNRYLRVEIFWKIEVCKRQQIWNWVQFFWFYQNSAWCIKDTKNRLWSSYLRYNMHDLTYNEDMFLISQISAYS